LHYNRSVDKCGALSPSLFVSANE